MHEFSCSRLQARDVSICMYTLMEKMELRLSRFSDNLEMDTHIFFFSLDHHSQRLSFIFTFTKLINLRIAQVSQNIAQWYT